MPNFTQFSRTENQSEIRTRSYQTSILQYAGLIDLIDNLEHILQKKVLENHSEVITLKAR